MSEKIDKRYKTVRQKLLEAEYKTKAQCEIDADKAFIRAVRGITYGAFSGGTWAVANQEKKFFTEAAIHIAKDYYYQGTDFWHLHDIYPPYPGKDGKISDGVCNGCHTKSPKEVTDKLKFILKSMSDG